MVTAGEVYTGLKGQSRGDNSGGALWLGSAPEIKNPYEDLTAQVLAQQGRDRLAKQKEAQAAKETVAKYADDLKINNFRDQYAGAAAKEILGQSNELGRMQAEGASPIAILEKKKAYEQENAMKSEKAKRTYDAIDKWKADGAKLENQDTLGKYDRDRYARKMDHLGELLDTGDFDAVEKFVTDPKNTPLVANVDPNDIVNNIIKPQYKENRDGSKEFDKDAAATNFGLFLNMEDSPEVIDALVKRNFGKDEAEVEANLMKLAEKSKPYNPAAPRSNSDGDGGTKSDYEAVATYNKDFGGDAGKTNVVTINPKGQTVKSVVFFDGQNQYQTSGQFSIHPDKSGKGYVVTALVAPTKPEPLKGGESKEEILAYEAAEEAYDSGKNVNKDFWVSNNPQDAGHTNYQTISNLIGQDLQTLIGQDTGGAAPSATEAKGGAAKKTIKRSEIRAKAAAAGDYTDAEYEAILKKNGVTITED
jgi:hypothetical protein